MQRIDVVPEDCNPQPACTLELDTTKHMVCVWSVYIDLHIVREKGAPIMQPVAAVSNITWVSSRTGYCQTPAFLLTARVPFRANFLVLSADGSVFFDDAGYFSFWDVQASSTTALDGYGCLNIVDYKYFSVVFPGPIPFRTSQGNQISYSGDAFTRFNFSADSKTLSAEFHCAYAGYSPCANHSRKSKVIAVDQVSGFEYNLWSKPIVNELLCQSDYSPKRGPVGTAVTVTGLYWTNYTYKCTFMCGTPTLVDAVLQSKTQLQCIAPPRSVSPTCSDTFNVRAYPDDEKVEDAWSPVGSFYIEAGSGNPTPLSNTPQSQPPNPDPGTSGTEAHPPSVALPLFLTLSSFMMMVQLPDDKK
jgi:hypothetical protein